MLNCKEHGRPLAECMRVYKTALAHNGRLAQRSRWSQEPYERRWGLFWAMFAVICLILWLYGGE